MKEVNVAIVGATGAVGEVMLELLAERDFPARSQFLAAALRVLIFASSRSFKWSLILALTFSGFLQSGPKPSRVCCYRQYVSLYRSYIPLIGLR